MKLNLEYYDEKQDLKPISEEYQEVLEKIEQHKTLNMHSDIQDIFALSDIRENILNWYPFKNDATILELNANYGEITGMLCRKAKKVVAIEVSKSYSAAIEKRHQDKENLELIVGNFFNIPLQEKFDYVVIVGIIENLKEAIAYAKEHLAENGRILLAVNNQFGVKAWITMKEEKNILHNQKTAISKRNLEELLKGMQYQYYYPLPDYKLPNIIYTDKHLPTSNDIYRDLTYKDGTVNFKELHAYQEIIKNNPEDFKQFANSYLLEIAMEEMPENDIQFISFSNIRKDEYRIQTIVKEKEVYKTCVNKKSKKHIEKLKENIEILNKLQIHTLDSYDEEKIISKYVQEKTLDEQLIEIYKEQGKNSFLQEIDGYKEFLKEKLEMLSSIDSNIFTKYNIFCEEQMLEKLTFVKYGFWDLIFQNCFIIEGEYYFYDQEWLEENVPIEYILYRAITYFQQSKQYISNEEIFESIGIKEFVTIFQELDNKLQENTRKPLAWELHSKEEVQKNKYSKVKKQLQQKEEEIEILKAELEQIKIENNQKQDQIVMMQNSFSWKITKPLRAIRRKIK